MINTKSPGIVSKQNQTLMRSCRATDEPSEGPINQQCQKSKSTRTQPSIQRQQWASTAGAGTGNEPPFGPPPPAWEISEPKIPISCLQETPLPSKPFAGNPGKWLDLHHSDPPCLALAVHSLSGADIFTADCPDDSHVNNPPRCCVGNTTSPALCIGLH